LEWSNFLQLPGDPRRNWELLCREVVRRHYERFGPLRTRKQQPGVEFHIALERPDCELGEVGRRWGWQCRWFDGDALRADGGLRADQRRSIEAAIVKSADHVDGLTDWVLWTREKLTADDARWFDALEAPFALHHWDEETLAGLMSGPAEILLETWFGDLVLDEETLTELRREALAPIEQRYVEQLHVRTATELDTKELLGSDLGGELLRWEQMLERNVEGLGKVAVEAEGRGLESPHREVWQGLEALAGRLEKLRSSLRENLPASGEELSTVLGDPAEIRRLEALIRECLAGIDPHTSLALMLHEAESGLEVLKGNLARFATGLRVPMMVVLGAAGAGKTHLAASLTGPEEKARGVLVLGRQFGARIDDDDIARFAGLGSTRDRLLEALDALGVREGRRVPLVIDGINESEDPSAWQVALARLRARVDRLDHVAVIVTVRPSYRRLAVPADVLTTELTGFSGVEEKAVARYFSYYKIDASPEAIHWWRPSDPLLLSIFCRTVNPERKTTVKATELPASLTEVLEAYLDSVCVRVATTMKIPDEDVAAAVLRLGEHCFWAAENSFDRDEVAVALGDEERAGWSKSLRFQLEAEEVLIRDVVGDRERSAWSYDLLAGHVLARGLLKRLDPPELAGGKAGEVLEAHPLCEDILAGLAGMLGGRGLELAVVLEPRPELAAKAALASVRLPAAQVGRATIDALHRLFAKRPDDVLEVIAWASLRRGHPLNAHLLDSLLEDLEVRERDLTWTEWMQPRNETAMQVGWLSEQWRTGSDSTDDEAAVVWLSWVMTATRGALRDGAIQALYRVGKRSPELLFARTLKMLGANDPAIAEGMMAASYGVAMASQDPSSGTSGAVIALAAELRDRLLGESASQPTTHWLIREYAYRTAQLASWLSDGEVTAPADAAQPPLPQPKAEVPCLAPGDTGWNEAGGASWLKSCGEEVRSLPAMERDREKLEVRFQKILGEIRARVWELGWRSPPFEPVDPEAEDGPLATRAQSSDRFGEKYASIAFYEALGRLSDRRELRTRPIWRHPDPPIDPSFPESAALTRLDLPDWTETDEADEDWALGKEDEVPAALVYREEPGGEVPWVAVNGYLWQKRHEARRSISFVIRGLLALDGWASIRRYIQDRKTEADLLPDNPVEYDCFAGEAPWSPTFDSAATEADGSFEPQVSLLGDLAGKEPWIELLGVDFKWSNERSALNSAEIGPMPSKSFSLHAGLRKVADRPEFVDPDGRPAAKTVSPRGIDGWTGSVLYVREDLLRAYCSERGGEWGWLVWGERQLLQTSDPHEAPLSAPQVGPRFLADMSLDEASAQRGG
jgi:hypothetical protein